MAKPVDLTPTVAASQDQHSAASNRDETLATPANPTPAATNFGPPAAPDEVGALGPHRILKQLGAGGMGAVYLAIDTRLNRKLALKVMLPEYAADLAAKERFLREARAAAQVTHDNVVTVYEADVRDGVPYIAMQFLQGYPLDAFLKAKGAPPLPHIIRIARETALGLAAAHALGLVHRDIKPANLWLEAPNGRVKVLDFGLAKPVGSDAELTRSGAVVGTPAYMSPEQARGLKVDHRTDLFSLGSVLYRLCTGKTPFAGPNVMAVLMALGSNDPTPVRELNPNLPESLAALIHQLLAKKPEDRPQTATEVAKRLRAILDELLAPTSPTPESAVPMAAEVSTSQPVVVHPLPIQPPMVMPMQITAQPENAFANLDANSAEVSSASETERTAPKPEHKPRLARKSGRGLLLAVAGVVLLAGIAVAVVAATRRNSREPDVKAPDTPAPQAKTDSKKSVAKTPDRAAAKTVDHTVAEWVLSVGGKVTITDATGEKEIVAGNPLPASPLTVTRIDLDGAKVVDVDMDRLAGLVGLTQLHLDHTGVTDDGLARIKHLTSLTRLHLGVTKVTDQGLTHIRPLHGLLSLGLHNTKVTNGGLLHLQDFTKLMSLNLNDTAVTDAGLEHVGKRKELKHLYLAGTKVTDTGLLHLTMLDKLATLNLNRTEVTADGVDELRKTLSKCKIEWEPPKK